MKTKRRTAIQDTALFGCLKRRNSGASRNEQVELRLKKGEMRFLSEEAGERAVRSCELPGLCARWIVSIPQLLCFLDSLRGFTSSSSAASQENDRLSVVESTGFLVENGLKRRVGRLKDS